MAPCSKCGACSQVLFANTPTNTTKKALVIEDVREACIELRKMNYECDRLTHNELMSHAGEEYTNKMIQQQYSLLWISTPADWYVRTPGQKKGQSTLAAPANMDEKSIKARHGTCHFWPSWVSLECPRHLRDDLRVEAKYVSNAAMRI